MLCKIYHQYYESQEPIYIETQKDMKELADAIVGLQFYIEDHTKYGPNNTITLEMAAYMLCEYFECKIVPKELISKYDEYDEDIDDVDDIYEIELYHERELRCGKDYKLYILKLSGILRTEFMKSLYAFFNNAEIFENGLASEWNVDDILAKYEYETSLEMYNAHLYCLKDFIANSISSAKSNHKLIHFKLMRWSIKSPYWCVFVVDEFKVCGHYCLHKDENLHHILTRLAGHNVPIIVDINYFK